MRLHYDRERIHNAASTHKGDPIAKALNYMVAEKPKQLSGVYNTGDSADKELSYIAASLRHRTTKT